MAELSTPPSGTAASRLTGSLGHLSQPLLARSRQFLGLVGRENVDSSPVPASFCGECRDCFSLAGEGPGGDDLKTVVDLGHPARVGKRAQKCHRAVAPGVPIMEITDRVGVYPKVGQQGLQLGDGALLDQ